MKTSHTFTKTTRKSRSRSRSRPKKPKKRGYADLTSSSRSSSPNNEKTLKKSLSKEKKTLAKQEETKEETKEPSNVIDFYNQKPTKYKQLKQVEKSDMSLMIEIIVNDRLGRKVRIKCFEKDTIGDLKKLIAAHIGTRADKLRL